MRQFAYAAVLWDSASGFHFVLDGKTYRVTNIKSNDELFGDVALVSYWDSQDGHELYARVIKPEDLKRAWETMEQAEARAYEARGLMLGA